MEVDQLEVIVVSNLNNEFFQSNTSSSFGNVLPRTTNFQDCEVALKSITFSDHYVKEDEGSSNPTDPPQPTDLVLPTTFFDVANKDNEITVYSSDMSMINVKKWEHVYTNFISSLQAALEEGNFRVTFYQKYDETGAFSGIKIELDGPPGFELLISEPLAKVLGFSETQFSIGETENDLVPDITFFNGLEFQSTLGTITLYKVKTTTAEIEQLEPKPKLTTILTAIVAALVDKDLDVSMSLNNAERKVEYDILPRRLRIQLSPFLNNYLGLSQDFQFHGESSIVIPDNIIEPLRHHVVPLGIKPIKTCSKLLVLANFVKPQVFAGKELQLLAMFDRTASEEFQRFHFEVTAPLYKPVVEEKWSQITLQLVDDRNNFLPVSDEPTVISLHFRRKKYL